MNRVWTKAIKIIAIFFNFYFAFADKFTDGDSSGAAVVEVNGRRHSGNTFVKVQQQFIVTASFQFQLINTLQQVANYQIWLHPAEGNRNVVKFPVCLH